MPRNAAELAHRLAREAEAVCRHYLSNGRRVGNYWQVGDVRNTAGRSMFVRLNGVDAGGRLAGKWTEHVAAKVMLRSCDWALFRARSEASRQHNLSAWRGRS
jgi:hypothetical protein